MRAGDLNEILTWRRRHLAPTESGATVESYGEGVPVRAYIERKGSATSIGNNEVLVDDSLSALVRYYNEVRELDRFECSGVVYWCSGIMKDRKNGYKRLTLRRVNE
jgi:head-tail adaptor